MSSKKAPMTSKVGLLQDAGKSRMTPMLTRQANPRHLLDKPKEELYLITKDLKAADSKKQVAKTIHNTLFMDDINDNIKDLNTLSYTLLKTTQLKDVLKAAIIVIRAIAQAINNVQEVLKE